MSNYDLPVSNNGPVQRLLTRVGAATIETTQFGAFTVYAYNDGTPLEHAAWVKGDIGDGEKLVTRMHSECLTGDVFGSAHCDCGPQKEAAMEKIAQEGRGIFLYLRQEGRGIGLGNKLRAYELQAQGRDTLDANLDLGFPIDARDHGIAAKILLDLGVKSVRLMTNNPDKIEAIRKAGIVVERASLITAFGPKSGRYFDTKVARMGHLGNSIPA
jgi:3,4-dihydroxy 2-butanone 4-phosphate synthase/GTP cyclohydrolase II